MSKLLCAARRALVVCAASILLGCGGNNDFARALPFEALDGTAARYSIGGGPYTMQIEPLPRPDAVLLSQVIQSNADLSPLRPWLEQIGRNVIVTSDSVLPNPPPILLLSDEQYFNTRTLLIVDFLRNDGNRLRLISVIETNERIEVTFELCDLDSTKSGIPSGGIGSAWFSIPKTTKPIVVRPLQLSTNPPWYAGQTVGRCQ